MIRCHTSLVTLLDKAAELGFEVTVKDESCVIGDRSVFEQKSAPNAQEAP